MRALLPLRTLAGIVALVAALGLGTCGDGMRQPRAVGIVANSLQTGGRPGPTQDAARAAGARWLREEVRWADIEPQRGVWRWRAFDRTLAGAARRGLRVLPLINTAPDWAWPDDGGLPTAADDYGHFVRQVVARYGPGGTFWRARPRLDGRLAPRWFELWNEPYFHRGDDGVRDLDANAARYAALAAAGIRAARAARPDVRLLVALHTSSSTRPGDHLAWLDALARADAELLAAADGFAVHPYGLGGPGRFAPLDELLAVLDERDLAQPLWITELGWSTCAADDDCVSERRQAVNLRTTLETLADRYADRVAAVFVYHLYDWRVRPRGGREGSYGLLRTDGSRKPAWRAYRRGVSALLRAR